MDDFEFKLKNKGLLEAFSGRGERIRMTCDGLQKIKREKEERQILRRPC